MKSPDYLINMWQKGKASGVPEIEATAVKAFLRYADSLGYKLRYDEENDETAPTHQEYKSKP